MVEVLRRKKIPFVIRGLSVLSNTLVRDLLAYLRLVAIRSDNVACARVVAAPYWGFGPPDLVRMAERGGRKQSLFDVLEAPQGELSFRPEMKTAELREILEGHCGNWPRARAPRMFLTASSRDWRFRRCLPMRIG